MQLLTVSVQALFGAALGLSLGLAARAIVEAWPRIVELLKELEQ